MDRINGEDTVDIGGGRRGFQGQNAAAGIPGTEVTAAYLNSVQEEIMAVIENAGLTADPNDWSQLWKALNQLTLPGNRGVLNWLAVRATDVIAPPANAQTGDTYLIPANATGAWQSHRGQIAVRDAAGWIYITPRDGHGFGLPDGRIFVRTNGVYIEKKEKAVSILAGNGLTGGGLLTQDRTLALSDDILSQIANAVMPAGAIQAFAMSNAPAGWLECDGRALSRTGFPALFRAVGTVWGTGNGSTTFNIPDFRGVFLRGWNRNSTGLDAGRIFASRQNDAFRSHNHPGSVAAAAGLHNHNYELGNVVYKPSTGGSSALRDGANNTSITDSAGSHTHNLNIVSEGGNETRPVNQAVVYAIKT